MDFNNNHTLYIIYYFFRDPPRLKVLSSTPVRGGLMLLTSYSGATLALQRITHPQFPMAWIRSGRLPRAVACLQAMDWEHEPDQCLHAFQTVTLSAYRHRLDSARSAAVQAAVGAALASPAAARAARRFHTQLLRHGRLDKALHLAIDVASWDVFLDCRWAAARAGRPALAAEAQELALQARINSESECSTDCSCCSSTCSQSSCSSSPAPRPPQPPPPLPRVTTVPVPIHQPEPTSTHSIRPNLHQYLERDLTIWNTEVKPPKPTVKWRSMDNMLDDTQGISRVRSLMTIDERPWMASVIDVVPRPYDDKMATLNYNNLYQRELKETENTMYRQQSRFAAGERGKERGRGGEKNVKFSDTVTIAVVPEPPGPSPARELAESLPLCAPHNYLAAFEPAGTRDTDYVDV
ncbi:hypothetical protein JYU34_009038 [Plutella xylostella]|uniref:Uncharacterized protein n=1 Tax=Plutella xylostella TaxID=51655 RepID=A0ABQ7QMX5_PLUXY|nr:hypothetical protein JYU34_009038 [Plutella xylostella]